MNLEETKEVIFSTYADWLKEQMDEGDKDPRLLSLIKQDLKIYSSIRSITPTSWYTIIIIRADYGDDGGPAELVVFMDPEYMSESPTIATMVQSFDTYNQVILDKTVEAQ